MPINKSHLRLHIELRYQHTHVAETPCGMRSSGGPKLIPESHPLQQLFQDLVGRHYAEEIGIRDPQIVAYVSHLLAEFCEADQLYKIHDAPDRPLADVGEMLLESDPVYGPAPSFDRERQVRKHIGDYTSVSRGHVPREHQSFPAAPPASGKFCRMGEGRQRRATTSFPSSSTSSTPRSRLCLRLSRRISRNAFTG